MSGSNAGFSAILGDALKLLGHADPIGASARLSSGGREHRRWVACLDEQLKEASCYNTLKMPGSKPHAIKNVHLVSDRGSAPAWKITTAVGATYKLRVCRVRDQVESINAFLSYTESLAWPACARRVTRSNWSILKTWIHGRPISEFGASARQGLIQQIGARLADLHSSTSKCAFLVCSADDYNTVITPEGQVVFIDLDASHCGSRWIDLVWSEELLCRSNDEVSMIWDSYLQHSRIAGPSSEEWSTARLEFLHRLMTHIQRARSCHPKSIDLDHDYHAIRSAIFKGGKGRVFPERPWY